MLKNLFLAVLALGLIGIYNSCSSSSDGGTETNNAAAGSGAAVTAVFSGMSGDASINEQARIPQSIINLFIKKAMAQGNFTACDAVTQSQGPEGITMTIGTEGGSGSYGHPDDLMEVAPGGTFSFCADNGDVATWEIPADVMEVECMNGDTPFTMTMSGSGVFREDSTADQTIIRGDFVMSDGTNTGNFACSFDISHTSDTFEGTGCYDTDNSTNIDTSDDLDCETPGSSSPPSGEDEESDSDDDPQEGEEDNGAPTCETADDCMDFATTEESCEGGFCNFGCEADSDCDELESSGESISCTGGSCIPE